MQTGVTDGLKGFIPVTEELEMKTKVNTKLSSGGKPGGPHVAPSRNDLPKNDQRKARLTRGEHRENDRANQGCNLKSDERTQRLKHPLMKMRCRCDVTCEDRRQRAYCAPWWTN